MKTKKEILIEHASKHPLITIMEEVNALLWFIFATLLLIAKVNGWIVLIVYLWAGKNMITAIQIAWFMAVEEYLNTKTK